VLLSLIERGKVVNQFYGILPMPDLMLSKRSCGLLDE